ncbi:MAG: helicase-related protein, partial [Bacteroidia bacterium]
ELNVEMDSDRDRTELWQWFYEIWSDKTGMVQDAKEDVLNFLAQLYTNNPPELIYLKTLYHLFESHTKDYDSNFWDNRTGFLDTQIWNMLYSFQKDAVKGAIKKINHFNGCILADSVGLGKTFEALAIIKYFELRNHKVLVLCPKKLAENWTVYQAQNNSELNPLLNDRLSYTVLSHTDLSREQGKSINGVSLNNINWGNFDLVVIDESHNFRNNSKSRRDEEGNVIRVSRYERLIHDIIKQGVNTKVLLLSATPVNNDLKDLRNQLYIITGGEDDAFSHDLKVPNLKELLRTAQGTFSAWSKSANRTTKNLLSRLDSRFFNLLDSLTIARSRKHIQQFYQAEMQEIGRFPERMKVHSISTEIDVKNRFPAYEQLQKKINGYKLAIFHPSEYLLEKAQGKYDTKKVKVFTQADRERHLIGMMRVNFLKRLESSIKAFEITLDRTIKRMDTQLKRIAELKAIDLDELTPDWENEEEDEEMIAFRELWTIGKKSKILLTDIDLKTWEADIEKDKTQLVDLYNNACGITPERDAKLQELKGLIAAKIKQPLNEKNHKVLIFTAFADTAYYLYDNLTTWIKQELGLHLAVVAGGNRENLTTFQPKGFKQATEFNHILTNFSPRAKKRAKMKYMPQEGEIDILIATDCISEGQNLQDCDYLINYDIHWNPVRLIQRFGRIDRLGSINQYIQMVNFWPTDDLDSYIKLKNRVESRMALADLIGTNEDNLLNNDDIEDLITEDLKFRNKQLLKLKEEVLDLEDTQEGVSLSEFSLEDFRVELDLFLNANETRLAQCPLGLYAVVPAPSGDYAALGKYEKLEAQVQMLIQEGVIFFLKQKRQENQQQIEKVNPYFPYFLVYIYDDGNVVFNYTHPKQILEIFRLLCQHKKVPYEELCDLFHAQTQQGEDMTAISNLLKITAKEIKEQFHKKSAQNLQQSRNALFVPQEASSASDFELITWLVIV